MNMKTNLRGLRGGSWILYQDFARAVNRYGSHDHPNFRNDNMGFRMCRVKPKAKRNEN